MGAPVCPGYCCEAFNVGAPQAFDARYRDDEDYVQVQGLLIYLGRFEGNPTGRTECGKRSTKRLSPHAPEGVGGHYHTCRAWNPETRLCEIYSTRPGMCRNYPNGDVCEFDGCDVGPTWGPYAGKSKTEVLAARAQAEAAQALDLEAALASLSDHLKRPTEAE